MTYEYSVSFFIKEMFLYISPIIIIKIMRNKEKSINLEKLMLSSLFKRKEKEKKNIRGKCIFISSEF